VLCSDAPSLYLLIFDIVFTHNGDEPVKDADTNHIMKVANKSFENVATVRCVAPTLTDRDVVQEELQTVLPAGNAAECRYRTFCLPCCCPK